MRKRRLRGVKQTQKESGSFGKKKRKRERKGREGDELLIGVFIRAVGR